MRSLGIRGMVLLVLAFAFTVPALASQPTEVTGYATVIDWDFSGDMPIATVDYSDSRLEGVVTHTFSEGRADKAVFEGCVDEVFCGTLDMLIVRTWGDAGIPGLRGRWVILGGTEELETLRGQGTFVLDSFDPVGGPYEGQIHFDPDQGHVTAQFDGGSRRNALPCGRAFPAKLQNWKRLSRKGREVRNVSSANE